MTPLPKTYNEAIIKKALMVDGDKKRIVEIRTIKVDLDKPEVEEIKLGFDVI